MNVIIKWGKKNAKKLLSLFTATTIILTSINLPQSVYKTNANVIPANNNAGAETDGQSTYSVNFNIAWTDNEDNYGTRPEDMNSLFTVKQFLLGTDPSTATTLSSDKYTITTNENGDLILNDVPANDSEGIQYNYFLVENNTISKNPEIGEYEVTYENIGEFSSQNDALFLGGTLNNTLQGNETFEADVSWSDGKEKEERPNLTYTLYRSYYNSDNTIDSAKINDATVVIEYSNVLIDKEDGTFTIENLDKFDSNGKMYFYFVVPTIQSDNYAVEIDNTDSTEAESVINAIASLNGKYVLNNGSINNLFAASAVVPLTVNFKTASLKLSSDTYVKFKLQKKSAGETQWTDVVAADKLVKTYDNDTTTISDNGVVIKLSGFSQNDISINDKNTICEKYDSNHKEVKYRWIETAISIDGTSEKTVAYNEDEAGIVTYQKINVGEILSGVGTNKTTAFLAPAQTTDYAITNTLTGEIQFEITMQWIDSNQNNVSSDKEGKMEAVYAAFDIIRNDGVKASDGSLKDIDGNIAFDNAIFLNSNNLTEAGNEWKYSVTNLPRFDEYGREYTYSISNTALVDPHGVSWKLDNAIEAKIITKEDNSKVYMASYQYICRENFNAITIDVEANWIDGSDVESRQEIKYEIYHAKYGDWEQAFKIAEGTLSAVNAWRDSKTLTNDDCECDDNYQHSYVVKEISVGGKEVTYIADNLEEIANAVGAGVEVGNIDNSGLDYKYDVNIRRNGYKYAITNKRVAKESIQLITDWTNANSNCDFVYQLIRKCEGQEDIIIETVSVDYSDTNQATINIENLDKYNSNGQLYTYEIKAFGIKKGDTTYALVNGSAKIDGVTYVGTVSYDKTSSTINGPESQYDGDIYVWKATVKKEDTVNLSANIVWRDTYESDRPDASIKVYRLSTKADSELLNAINDQKTSIIAQILTNKNNSAKLVNCNQNWTKNNKWLWTVDLGEVAKYDAYGYEYVYFAVEEIKSSKETYSIRYCNLNCGSTGYRPKTTSITDSESVFNASKDILDSAFVILADGINQNSTDVSSYYSCTIVNTVSATKNISGKVTVKTPEEMPITKDQLCDVAIDLYRTTLTSEFEGNNYTNKQLKTYIFAAGEAVKKIKALELTAFQYSNSVGYSFSLNQDKYDEFGREYNYYILETKNNENYPDTSIVTDMSTFEMQYQYLFEEHLLEIPVYARWDDGTSGRVGEHFSAPGTIRLYAQMQDSSGNTIGEKYLMSEEIVYHDEGGSYSIYFNKYTEASGDYEDVKLTCIAPNLKPWVYTIEFLEIGGYKKGTEISPIIVSNPTEELTTTETFTCAWYYTGGGTTSFTIEEKWDDGETKGVDNSDYRPSTVSVELYRKWEGNPDAEYGSSAAGGGDELIGTYDLSASAEASQNWKKTINNLLKYDENGMPYTYYVKTSVGKTEEDQTKLTSYNSSISSGTITNTLKKIDITYSLEWNLVGVSFDQETFEILRDLGTLPQNVKLYLQRKTSSGDWQYIENKQENASTILNSDKNVIGKSFNISKTTTFTEFKNGITNIVAYYLPEYENNMEANNEYKYEYRVIQVLTWSDGIERIGTSPNELTPDPRLNGYSVSTTTSGGVGVKKIKLTNTISVKKAEFIIKWDDNNNCDDTRPETVNITLHYGENSKTFTASKSTDTNSDGNTYTTGKINIPKPTVDITSYSQIFSVTEDLTGIEIAGDNGSYEMNSENCGWTSTNNICKYTIENDLVNHIRDNKNVKAKVSFSDSNLSTDMIAKIRPNVKLTLYYKSLTDNKYYPVSAASEADLSNSDNFVTTNEVVDLSQYAVKVIAADSTKTTFEHTFSNLTKSWSSDGSEIEYAIRIDYINSEGTIINSSYSNASELTSADNSKIYAASYDETEATDIANITNTVNTKPIMVKQSWNYNGGTSVLTVTELSKFVSDKFIPDSIKYELSYKTSSMENAASIVTSAFGTNKLKTDGCVYIISEGNPYGFPRYDKEGNAIVYTVTEKKLLYGESENAIDGVAGITVRTSEKTVDLSAENWAADFTNDFETVTVSNSIIWDDNNNQDGKRPSSVTVKLLADGEQISSLNATSETNWAYSFSKLPKYKAGTEIVYSISVDTVTDYTANVEGQAVTLKHVPAVTSVSGEITWNDTDDQDGKRPASVTINLLADGTVVNNVNATLATDWKYSFTNIPKYSSGTEITYTVSVGTVTAYTSTITGNDIELKHILESTSVSGKITWDDNNNQDGKRPTSVTVNLLADGVIINYATATEATDWKYNFTALPTFKDGNEITYTVSNGTVTDYLSTVTGNNIELKHTLEVTSVSGKITWNDADNQDGKRPASVTINLLADGTVVNNVDATLATDWKYSFTNIPKYKEGTEITYTISVGTVTAYTSTITDNDIELKHEPEVTSVAGAITWEDTDNKDNVRPASATINLLADGEKIDSIDATAETDWGYSFEQLPKYKAGTEIAYTISCEEITNYEITISDSNITCEQTGGHNNTEIRNSKDATYTEDGYSGDVYCKGCGILLTTGSKIDMLKDAKPYIKGDANERGFETIEACISSATEGSTITVVMNGEKVVPGDVFESIKGKDVTVVFDMGDNISWTVNGKDVTSDNINDIDFGVITGAEAGQTIPVSIINEITGEISTMNITLAYSGEFGFKAILSINLGIENKGYLASLYYFNETTKALDYVCETKIDENGVAALEFTHASDYVIVISEKATNTPEDPENPTEPVNPENPDTPEDIPTGVSMPIVWLYVVMLIGTGSIGALGISKKRKAISNK